MRRLLFQRMKGNTLIEALAALSIIAIVVSAIASVVILALNNSYFTKNKTLAGEYAQQAMESMRQLRGADYDAFRTYNGTYCLGKGEVTLDTPQSVCSLPNLENFIRSVTIEQSPGCGTNVAKITVQVAWTDGKCSEGAYCHKEVHTSCFSIINPVKPL